MSIYPGTPSSPIVDATVEHVELNGQTGQTVEPAPGQALQHAAHDSPVEAKKTEEKVVARNAKNKNELAGGLKESTHEEKAAAQAASVAFHAALNAPTSKSKGNPSFLRKNKDAFIASFSIAACKYARLSRAGVFFSYNNALPVHSTASC